jgi:hypothetical protein
MSNPQLCIPRIPATTTREFIFQKFCKIDWGYIEYINEIPLIKEPEYKRIIIKIKWNKKSDTLLYKSMLEKGETVKFVYDHSTPWFWKISKLIYSESK